MNRRILIVDDHPMVATALSLASHAVDSALLIDTAATLGMAEQRLRQTDYALVMLDLLLPDVQGFSGLALVRALRPNTPVVLVTSRDEPAVARQALTMGARGFFAKSTPMEGMIAAITVLLQGGLWFPSAITLPQATDEQADIAKRIGELSVAQLRVLQAIASGQQNKQIAHDLGIAEPTVKSHLASVFRKLGVSNRTQAVLMLQAFDGGIEAQASAACSSALPSVTTAAASLSTSGNNP